MTFRLIEKYGLTIYYGVPTLYAAQCRALETESPDLSSLCVSVSAGESLPAPIFYRWEEKVGIRRSTGSDRPKVRTSSFPTAQEKPRPARGKVLPGYKARIVDDDGNDVEPGR